MVDARDRPEDGARPGPLPADLVAVGVQDAAHLLDRVGREAAIEEQFLVEEFDHVDLDIL